MKLSEIPKHITEVAQCSYPDLEDMEPLYHLSYYDGPLSGVCRVRHPGTEWTLYFCEAAYPGTLDRSEWLLWELTPEELTLFAARHALFQKHVGLHTDYSETDSGWRRTVGALRPTEQHALFYKSEQPPLDTANIRERDFDFVTRNPFY